MAGEAVMAGVANPGLYIHIPFCMGKCPYCDFYSVGFDDDTADAYVDAICRVMTDPAFSGRLERTPVDTVYFGGGTPSLMGAKRLGKILEQAAKHFSMAADPEITLEANPTCVGKDLFKGYRDIGINRLSMGVQSGIDRELALLGRRHGRAEAEAAVLSAFDSGFANISVDLMLAIPEQTMESLGQSVDFLTGLPVSHISAYLLKVEEGTAFHSRGVDPDEDLSADLYLECVWLLTEKGFPQYEISNFARLGRESKHNMKYWLGTPYLGIGPAAHSCAGGRRFYFARDLKGFLGNPLSTLIDDGSGGGFEEYVMLRLRLTGGIDLAEAGRLFPKEAESLQARTEPFLKRGLIKNIPGRIALTPEGFLLSNTVIGALLE